MQGDYKTTTHGKPLLTNLKQIIRENKKLKSIPNKKNQLNRFIVIN